MAAWAADHELAAEKHSSEASTVEMPDVGSVSDLASSDAGSAADCHKRMALPIRPRWSDMCGDEGDGLLDAVAYDEELLACSDSPDASPKSPSKGARRAQRRRRRREEAKAAGLEGGSPADSPRGHSVAAAAAAALEAAVAPDPPQQPQQQQQPQTQLVAVGFVPAIQVTPVTCGGGPKLLLPAAAMMDPGMKGQLMGNCTPTCVASPQRAGGVMLPSSPCRARSGSYVATSPTSMQGVLGGDASTRTPTTGTCGSSPFLRSPGPMCTDASARTPTARTMPAWASPTGMDGMRGATFAAAPSPNARGGGSAGSIVSTSPVGSASLRSSPMSSGPPPTPAPSPYANSGHNPAGSAAADALRTLLGPAGMPSQQELFAKLLAATPETYED